MMDATTPLALSKTASRAFRTPSSSPYKNRARESNAAGEVSGEDKRLIIWINREILEVATLYCGQLELGYLQIKVWSAWIPQEVSPAESRTALARGTITCKCKWQPGHEQDSVDTKSITYHISCARTGAFFVERENEKAVEVMSKISVYVLNPIRLRSELLYISSTIA
jgi:hypothetical protein